ncbi:MAG: hypothetical protein Q4A12_04505 [Eubacteriales bacterium]|nr:hypothetical protein [Eubacteriales bacterium]
MSLKDVIDRFALVSGLEQEEISKWFFLILDCIQYFESKTKNKSLSESDKKRLSYACAVYAYYKYSLTQSIATAYNFKAGDVEITQSSSMIESAVNLWQQQKQEISDIVDLDDFCFTRVRA